MHPLKHIVPHPLRKSVNKAVRKWRFRMRYATADFRSLPHFMIIGAMKSGTTSLFSCLVQHPQILKCFRKEVHFFDNYFNRGTKWYRAHFPLAGKVGAGRITGEATPLYIFNPLVPERISRLLPNVKLIAILRNPVERAISHYFMEVRAKRERLPVMEAFRGEENRLEEVMRNCDFTNSAYIHASYKKRGIYDEQLARYLQFFPRRQLLVLKSEAFFSEPRDVVRRIFKFLEVDESFEITDIQPRNVGSGKTRADAEVYDYLSDFFRPHNQALYELLGEDFDWS
jgi:hypothetical protein